MSSEPVITLQNVWKKYSREQVLNNSLREQLVSIFTGRKQKEELSAGEFWALNNISLSVAKGSCIGLAGHNGSGKSTILKLISNVTYPTRGTLKVAGRVAPLIELGAGMHLDLTGTENIFMNGSILGLTISEIKRLKSQIISFSGLDEFINIPVKKYSSGMYLRLAFSIAVHSPADIFLFDEVLSVGDDDFQTKCNDKIAEIRSRNGTILVVSHDHTALARICDRIITLDHGFASSGVL